MLPKHENGISVNNFIEMIHRDVVPVLASRAYEQNDIVVEGTEPHYICGKAIADIAINTVGYIRCEEGIEVNTNRGHTGEIFTTLGQQVYWDRTNNEYYTSEQAGFFNVGFITRITDANGSFAFEKYRYVEIIPAT